MNTTHTETITCDCGANGCNGVVIALAPTKLAGAKSAKERRTMVHNYVQRRAIFAMKGHVTIVKG